MDTDFKITIQCEPRDVTNFQKSLLQDENKSEYPELARYNNEMIKKSLEKGQENVRKQRYLTVSANCRSIEEAEGWFDTFEHTALPIFHAMGSELVPLNAVQRFQKIRNYFSQMMERKVLFSRFRIWYRPEEIFAIQSFHILCGITKATWNLMKSVCGFFLLRFCQPD